MWCPLSAAQLLFALLSLLAGRCQAQSVYPDFNDPACTVGQQCSSGIGPADPNRGLCVTAAAGQQCWDACNTNHTPASFSTTNPEGMALLVQQVRTVNGLCPGMESLVECNVGQRCTPPALTLNRGMCSLVDGVNKCLDMCDMSIPISTFKSQPAEQEGTVNTVNLVRAGKDPAGYTTCPGPSVWTWLWIPLLLCIIIACCGGGWKAYDYWRKTLQNSRRGGAPRRDYGAYPEDGNAPMYEEPQDYQQVMQQELDMPVAPIAEKQFEQQFEQPMPAPEPIIAEPMPVMEPLVEYEAPAYSTQNLFGTPSLQQQQMAAPATFYTSQPAQGYPAQYSYAAPAATVAPTYQSGVPAYSTSYAMAQPAYYMQQPTGSMRIG